LEHHAICSLDLAVAPWVGHQRVVDVDGALLAKIPKVQPCKGLSKVGDNPVGYPEPVGDALDEFRGLFFDVTVGTAQTSIDLVNLWTATRMCL
jgi:hypothetical protein